MKKISITLIVSIACITSAFAQDEVKKQKSSFHIDSLAKEKFDFFSIEKQPEYPGGLKNFYQYLGNSIRYPKQAYKDKVGGQVVLSFVVEKDGSLTNAKVVRGVRDDIDTEAIRVIMQSPKWNPGIQNGKPVRVKYNINVNFAP